MTDQFDDAALDAFNRTRGREWISGKPLPLTAADRIQIAQAAAKARAAEQPVVEVERCALSDLPKDSCSHCRPGGDRPPVKVDGRHRIFTAQFPGTCAVCDEPYPAGVLIARLPDSVGYAGPCCRDDA
ncbi:hypothetical protein [Amycolatopsis sp. NPDC059657]|uniref:hypothetical protein n=1 Tax=Amycolatopsis sp. NPDC059657 TaxID=3346899 RepID=UPI0036720206